MSAANVHRGRRALFEQVRIPLFLLSASTARVASRWAVLPAYGMGIILRCPCLLAVLMMHSHACRHLSSRLFSTPTATFHPLYDFLRTLQNNGEPLMVGKSIKSVEDMHKALSSAEKLLIRCDAQVTHLRSKGMCRLPLLAAADHVALANISMRRPCCAMAGCILLMFTQCSEFACN